MITSPATITHQNGLQLHDVEIPQFDLFLFSDCFSYKNRSENCSYEDSTEPPPFFCCI